VTAKDQNNIGLRVEQPSDAPNQCHNFWSIVLICGLNFGYNCEINCFQCTRYSSELLQFSFVYVLMSFIGFNWCVCGGGLVISYNASK